VSFHLGFDPTDAAAVFNYPEHVDRLGSLEMVKDCPTNGHFEDVISIAPAFSRHLEQAFPGRDLPAHRDERLHNHGSSSIRNASPENPVNLERFWIFESKVGSEAARAAHGAVVAGLAAGID